MDPWKKSWREENTESILKSFYPLPLRNYTDVHLGEHVQFLPKPPRIPEQPTEHAPRGLYCPLLPS